MGAAAVGQRLAVEKPLKKGNMFQPSTCIAERHRAPKRRERKHKVSEMDARSAFKNGPPSHKAKSCVMTSVRWDYLAWGAAKL